MNQSIRIEMLKQYVQDDPSDAFSRYALALEYVKSGSDTEALKLMEELYNLHPDYLPNYYHFGKLTESRDPEAAKYIYEQGKVVALLQKDIHTQNELQGAIDNLE